MKKAESFRSNLLKIAVPVTLQSLLQASFSVVDQIMTGQLGSVSIAGIGLGGKFSSLFSVIIAAVAAAAGIMIAQFIGKNNIREVGRSFYMNLFTSLLLAVIFTALAGLFPVQIMGLYTKDGAVNQAAADYLRILSVSFVPIAVGTLLSTLLRCIQAAMLPLYAGIAAALLNTGINYILIFGKLGFPAMGVKGAAGRQYAGILLPLLVCGFFWSLGENIYASVYGHMGTNPCAAMTLTAPIQGLTIGALSGLSQAAGIMTGKSLGAGDYNRAYKDSKKLMLYGVPLGFLSAFVWKLPIPYVYFVLSLEECVRFALTLLLFKHKSWMNSLNQQAPA